MNQNEEDTRGVEVNPLSALEAQTRAEIDMQVRTAKAFPRSVRQFLDDCTAMATLNEEVAGSCIYALPRAGKSIEGPSARLAEIILSAWGNCMGGARVIDEDARFVTAQGVFRDLERNTCITFEVRRRITDKGGRKFKDDMIGVTANAACSIALRNAVFKGVPKAFWDPIYEAARKTAIGDVKTIENRRAALMEHFQKMGVTEEQILELLGLQGIEDMGPKDILMMRGLATALKDGDTTIEEAFGRKVSGGNRSKTADTQALNDELMGRKQADETTEPATGGQLPLT